jgi:hypothetical protein
MALAVITVVDCVLVERRTVTCQSDEGTKKCEANLNIYRTIGRTWRPDASATNSPCGHSTRSVNLDVILKSKSPSPVVELRSTAFARLRQTRVDVRILILCSSSSSSDKIFFTLNNILKVRQNISNRLYSTIITKYFAQKRKCRCGTLLFHRVR